MADEPGSHGLLSVQLPSESQVFSAFALSARMAGKGSIRTVGQQLQNFFEKMKKKLAFLKKLLYNITCVEESSTGKKNKRD